MNRPASNEERYDALVNTYGDTLLTIIKKCRADYDELVPPDMEPRVSLPALTAHMIAAFLARDKHEYEKPGFTSYIFSRMYQILHKAGDDGTHVSALVYLIMMEEGRS